MDKTCKYYQYQRYVSYDNGQTWQPMNQFQRGELMEFNSPDCGAGVDALYKWVLMDANTDYYCDECPEGTCLEPTDEYIESWGLMNPYEDYWCSGTTKMYKQIKQISYDSGNTWIPTYPPETAMTNFIVEEYSEDCGFRNIYRWVDDGEFCDEGNKYMRQVQQKSFDGGTTWFNTGKKNNILIEENSSDCVSFSLTITGSGSNFNDVVVPSMTVSGTNGFSGSCTYDGSNSTDRDRIKNIIGTPPYKGNLLTFDSRNNGNYYPTITTASLTTLEGVTYTVTVRHKGYAGGVTIT